MLNMFGYQLILHTLHIGILNLGVEARVDLNVR